MTDMVRETWREQYRATSEALERIRAQELAALTEEEAMRQIKSLRAFGPVEREMSTESGLVEQQAVFHRKRAA
jgi:hypothetical protein